MPAVARTADSPYAAYAELLTHPHVRQAMWKMVRRLPRADSQDLISQSFEALWRRRDDPHLPDCIERMIGLARRVMEAKVVDYYRRRDVERARIVDAPHFPRDEGDPPPAGRSSEDQPNFVDEIVPPRTITAYDRLEVKQRLAFLNASAPKVGITDDDVEVMLAVDVGELTLDQASVERAIPGSALRMRLLRIRRKLDHEWTEHVADTPRALLAWVLRLHDRLVLQRVSAQGGGVPRWLSKRIEKFVRSSGLSL
jgi:DNA-directed RNA polymerase specialized sigma24 family protein